MMIYIDAIFVGSTNMTVHLSIMKEVLGVFDENALEFQFQMKCHFSNSQI